MLKKSNTNTNLKKTNFNKVAVVFLGSIAIGLVLLVSFYSIPNLYYKTEQGVAELQKEEKNKPDKTEQGVAELQKEEKNKPERDLKTLDFSKNSSIVMKTNFGELNIELSNKTPETKKHFIETVVKEDYNKTSFHRMTERDGFSLIQGGDIGSDIVAFKDEIWEKSPELLNSEAGSNQQKKDVVPVPLEPSYYDLEYSEQSKFWNTKYKKGMVVMANKGPDTNTSQFFIILEESTFQPNYAVFGRVIDKDLQVLDKILAEVDPVDDKGKITGDGTPSQSIVIDSTSLVQKD